MNSDHNLSDPKRNAASIQASDDARKLFACLLLAFRNLSLYSKDHVITLNSLRQLHGRLEAYIRRYGDFRIEIGKGSVTCRGAQVYAGPDDEGSLVFTLFRDGIRWLEFEEGVGLEEVQELLSIVNRHGALTVEPGGDVATDLWEAGFACIRYATVDFFPALEPGKSDFLPTLNTESMRREETPENAPEEGRETPGSPEIDPAALVLNPREEAQLQEMIFREETAPASAHLNILLDSLISSPDEESFQVILDVLSEEFTAFLSGHDFPSCLAILEGLKYITSSGRLEESRLALIENIFSVVSDTHHLKPLAETWERIPAMQAGMLERIFRLLHPPAVETLARLLLTHRQDNLQVIAENAILSLVHRDGRCLEALLRHSDDRIAARLVPVFSKLNYQVALPYLMRLARHASAPIRRLAVRALLDRQGAAAEDIFSLLDDPDAAVRRMVLRQLGQSRDETAEELLVGYLQTPMGKLPNPEHILECFRTLGKCATARSVPFLRETLMRRKWTAGFSKSIYRQGAALALAALETPEARRLIKDAKRSIHPGLRRLAHDAIGKPSAEPGEMP